MSLTDAMSEQKASDYAARLKVPTWKLGRSARQDHDAIRSVAREAFLAGAMTLTDAAQQLNRLYWQAQNGDRDPITPSQIEQLGSALGIDPTDRLPEDDDSEEGPV